MRTLSRGFAGRREELAELATGVASADRGVGRTFLVNGEPGIGKTRFCEEVATRASSDGARVLWGRCWEGAGAPVYWPWIQIMRPLLRSPDRDRLLGAVEPERAYLEQILPEVARNNIGVNVEVVESDRGRFYVFDAVATLLATASEERTLVLILDDLHHADRPTLMLLDFIAANLRDARVVTLGTYRPADVQLDPDRGHILASAARRSRVIPLSGLTPSEVTELIDATEGIDLPSETISALVALSEGNPFFLDEFVRLVVSEGTDLSDIAVPHGVREIIRQRVRPLSVATRQLLDIAAVIGRESTLAVLERVADLPRDSTRDGLWAAERSGIIDEAGLAPGVYRFVHALIRETLYEDLPPSERAQIHLRVARALEDLYPHDVDQRVIEIAHHYFRALEGGIGEAASRAIEHLTAAGGSSMERFAWEEAAHHFGEALTALDLASDDPSARIELLLKRGEALKRGADLKGSLDAFAAAAEVARALDDPGPSLARAAIGFEDARWADINLWRMPEAIMLLREALGSLGPDDKASRSAVLARLCPPLNLFGTTDDAVASGREALALAEELGDPRLIGSALDGLSWALAVPAHTPERVDVIERLIQVAKQLGDEWLEVNAHLQRAQILLEMGRADALTEEIARYDLHAPGPHEDFFVWWGSALRASRAFMLGRFDDVELELAALRDVGDRGGSMTYGVTAWLDAALGWALGDADRIAAAATDIVSFVPIPAFRQGIEVFVATAAGDRTRAQEAFASVAANDFTGIPVNYIWCSVLAGMAWCAPFAATGEATEKLYALLEPYPRRVPLMPPIGFVTTSHWLGVLAAKLGRVDTARAHFEEALTLHTTLGARPWLACTLSEYGVMLLEHGDEDERVRAIDMLHDALAVADGLGMAPVASRARAALGPHATAPAGPAREYAPGNTFRPEGEWWTVSFRGRISRLNGTKGLAYLRTLLAAPGREVHVLQLVGADDAMTSAGPGDALLDDKARVAYRERIADLRADIDDAEAFSDTERAARARAELDTITEQLASATGLGGRDRRSASATERARVNVTRAIKAALMRIQAVDPALAEHLTVLVRTGTFCSYATDPSDPVLWTTLESGPD